MTCTCLNTRYVRLTACIGSLMCASIASAQQLPTSRNALAGDDSNVAIHVEATLTYEDQLYDEDIADDSISGDDYQALNVDASLFTFAGRVGLVVMGHASGSNPNQTAQALASTWTKSGLDLYFGGGTRTSWDADVNTVAEYTINANPSFPTAGQAANSATLNASLKVRANGSMDEASQYDVYMYAKVGDSYVSATPLDAEGETWAVTGSLSQSTSANPTASPSALNTTMLVNGNPTYNATQVTNVNDVITCEAQVYVDVVEILNEGLEEINYWAQGSFVVYVP